MTVEMVWVGAWPEAVGVRSIGKGEAGRGVTVPGVKGIGVAGCRVAGVPKAAGDRAQAAISMKPIKALTLRADDLVSTRQHRARILMIGLDMACWLSQGAPTNFSRAPNSRM